MANVAAAASVLRVVAGCASSGLYVVRGCRVGFWCLVGGGGQGSLWHPAGGDPNYGILVFRKSLWTVLHCNFGFSRFFTYLQNPMVR